MPGQDGARRQQSSTNLIFAVLAVAGASYALLQSLVAPALPEIQQELGVTPAAVAWVFTAYLLSASVMTPIAGRLGDMFGKKRVLVIVMLALVAGSLLAALASTLGVLIVARTIQGAGGAVFPLAFGIIRDEFPRHRVAGAIALISALLGVGGGLGIVLAGPIINHLSYHWLFWIPFVIVSLATVAAIVVIPESPVRSPGTVNWVGAVLLAGWLTCLLMGTSQAPSWGWLAPRTLGLFAASAILIVGWVKAEQRSASPLVDMRMMRLRGVWTTNAAGLMIGFGMFSSFILIPQFVETPTRTGYGFGASVTQAGLFLLPTTTVMLLVSPIAGRLSNSVGSRVPLALGALLTSLVFVMLATAHSEPWEVYVASALLGAGIGLSFASMSNLIVESVTPEQTGVATGMNAITRTIGGAIGGTVAASILSSHLAPNGRPSESAFTITFAVCAAVVFGGFLASLAVPRRITHVAVIPAGRDLQHESA